MTTAAPAVKEPFRVAHAGDPNTTIAISHILPQQNMGVTTSGRYVDINATDMRRAISANVPHLN